MSAAAPPAPPSGITGSSTDPGVCAIQGDLREPPGILGHPELRAQIDLRQPVAILLTAVLHSSRTRTSRTGR